MDVSFIFKYLFFICQAALGIANLIVMAMMESGISSEEAYKKIWMFDKYGLLVQVRVCQAFGIAQYTLPFSFLSFSQSEST